MRALPFRSATILRVFRFTAACGVTMSREWEVRDRSMTPALCLLAVLGLLGAFDTLYYHEWRARLPALGKSAGAELKLHAWRDFVYAALFCTLPWIAWQGRFALVLAGLLLAEIFLTLWDFVVEDWIRKPIGGVYAGERVMHAVMGIVYGAMLTFLLRTLAYCLRVCSSCPLRARKSFAGRLRRWASGSWSLVGATYTRRWVCEGVAGLGMTGRRLSRGGDWFRRG